MTLTTALLHIPIPASLIIFEAFFRFLDGPLSLLVCSILRAPMVHRPTIVFTDSAQRQRLFLQNNSFRTNVTGALHESKPNTFSRLLDEASTTGENNHREACGSGQGQYSQLPQTAVRSFVDGRVLTPCRPGRVVFRHGRGVRTGRSPCRPRSPRMKCGLEKDL